MKLNIIYSAIVIVMFLAFAIVFNTFPRSTYSELEKRELAKFPEYSAERLKSGEFTRDISTWFSDSEPYRDVFMGLSMEVDNLMRVAFSEDNISFQAPVEQQIEEEPAEAAPTDTAGTEESEPIIEGAAKIANAGIMIVGTGENVRALMAYGGSDKMGGEFARTANKYRETFGDGVSVYVMAIPTAIEFYCPTKAKNHTKPQRPTIDNIHSQLASGVKAVDAHAALKRHWEEDIYLRTDHHWAPLGAYYAAQEFAETAGVPFPELSTAYTQHVVHRFVGSMYGYSKDVAVKNAPEDFVYYTPNNVDYSTTYINYSINKNYQVTGESHAYKGTYFFTYKDGNGAAYSTFMGGDTKLTVVKTSTGNGRRLMIIKDSFGNALPGYLFYSFEEVHVVDFRYFTKNMTAYVKDNGITDILFAYNIFNTCSAGSSKRVERFLTQKGGTYAPVITESDSTATHPSDTVATPAVPATSADGATEEQQESGAGTSENAAEKEAAAETSTEGETESHDASASPQQAEKADTTAVASL